MLMLQVYVFIAWYRTSFLQEIYELGSGEQGEVTSSTSEQSAMETSNEETDNKVKSSVSHLQSSSFQPQYSQLTPDHTNMLP